MKRTSTFLCVLLIATTLWADGDPVPRKNSIWNYFPFSVFIRSNPAHTASKPLTQTLPLDEAVNHYTLSNGMTCYIVKNNTPEQRASLRLIVKAGSIHEDDDQSGIAHLVEHLAFCGSTHFKQNELIDRLEALGVRYGPELNASTSYERTSYILDIPVDDEKNLDTALIILSDWAQGLTLKSDQIEHERSVIKEEWRRRQHAKGRLSIETIQFLFSGSRFALREPMGQMDLFFAVPHERIRDFYRKWYHPGRMALIAVGDFDTALLRRKIDKHFSFQSQKPVPGDPAAELENYRSTEALIFEDRELSSTRVSLYHRIDNREIVSSDDLRDALIESLCFSMLSERMEESAREADSPCVSTVSGGFSFNNSIRFALAAASPVSEDRIEQTVYALVKARTQAGRYGFTQSELDRQKRRVLSYFENLYNERNNREHDIFVEQLQSHFLDNETMPGIEWEYRFYTKLMPELTLAQINNHARRLFSAGNARIVVSGPSVKNDKNKLCALYAAALKSDIGPYSDISDSSPLSAQTPKGASVMTEEYLADTGVYLWTLSNGARVAVKKTDFKKDEILMYAFSAGGTSMVSDEHYVAASTAMMIASESGCGDFDRSTLRKNLSGTQVSLTGFIGSEYEGFEGFSGTKDLETLLILQYLSFNQPRFDTDAFELTKRRLQTRLADIENDPEAVFTNTIRSLLMSGSERATLYTPLTLQRLDLTASKRIYAERFRSASDFVWVFTGAVNIPRLKVLTEKYIASLPSDASTEKWRDLGIRPPTGFTHKTVKRGADERSRVSIYLRHDNSWNRKLELITGTAGNILDSRLNRRLRESMMAVYAVEAHASVSNMPYGHSTLYIGFSCDPARVDELSTAALEELATLANTGPNSSEIDVQREQFTRRMEIWLRDNEFWNSHIAEALMNNEKPEKPFDTNDFNALVNSASLQDIFAAFQNSTTHIRVDLVPENIQ